MEIINNVITKDTLIAGLDKFKDHLKAAVAPVEVRGTVDSEGNEVKSAEDVLAGMIERKECKPGVIYYTAEE